MNHGSKNKTEMYDLLRSACNTNLGALDLNFLCKSIGALSMNEPLIVQRDTLLSDVMQTLQENKTGCVLVCDSDRKLCGIFSERDYVLKAYGNETSNSTVGEFMTEQPVAESPECTIAFALNLMSQGGFRHLPIVDKQKVPVGMLSVKDMIDHIVSSYLNEMLEVEIED